MKNKEIMKGDVCSPDLCDIILDDVIGMLKNGSIKTGNCKGTIKAIKKVGSARAMFLQEYEDKKIIEFTIIDIYSKSRDYMNIKITFNNEEGEIYMQIASNLNSDNFFSDKV
ncbi:MAG: hypothetical protein ABW185_26075 [Sedimenticola sp.]